MKNQIRFLLATLACVLPGMASAAEVGYTLRAGVTHSDNIERLPDDQARGTRSAVAGLALQGTRDTGRLQYRIDTDLSYYEYLNLDLDPELLGNADLGGAYHFIPERLLWNASLSYDQIREDILRPAAAGNRESQVAFSTGPSLRTRIGVVDTQLDAHYARLDYGTRPLDNETLGARMLLGRRPGARSLVALGYAYDDVSYASSGSLDYDRQEVFARVELEGVRTQLDIEAGYAEVSGALVDDGGLLVRTRLQRRMTPSLTGFIGYVREYPTSEESVAVDAGAGSADASQLTSAPRTNTRIETGVRLERPRSSAELAYAHRRESALLAGIGSRDYDEIRARVSRAFTPRSRGTLYASATREDLSIAAGRAGEHAVGLELGYTFGRALGLDLRVEYRDRNGVAAQDTYDEFSAGLFLRYSGAFGRRATP